MRNHRILKLGVVALSLLVVAGCGDLLNVDAPGRIADADLNNQDAISGLVVGMSRDLTVAYDAVTQDLAMASGELWHGGSYDFGQLPQGIITPEDVNGEWADMQRARWVAEHGIERMQNEMPDFTPDEFNSDPRVARAYLLAGFANRLLGENTCQAVIDGGAAEDHTVFFSRAENEFGEAIRIGNAAGADDVVAAAYGGRASVRAWQDDWSGAVADAQQVPDDFVYYAIFQQPQPENDLAYETHSRREFTVWNTEFADHYGDPRIPWDTAYAADGSIMTGQDGVTYFFQQNKLADLGADIPMVKGTEMLVLRAEAALQGGTPDLAAARDLMNQARAVYGMTPLPAFADATEAWTTLHYERGATLWLEARRLWDARRWFEATGPEHWDYLQADGYVRDGCFPISEEEVNSNPNLGG
jgi:hypothetical protein